MSVLNQMLNDLEKRGANGPLADMPVRAVHAQGKSHIWAYAAAGVLLLGVCAAGWWLLYRPVAVPAL
ncbi:MAG: hypothetical protein WC825_11030, partial [Gallionellaceae bacterium]